LANEELLSSHSAALLVRSSSKRGIAMFRILVDREERLGALRDVQKQAACTSL
jgi:hypothetical protein